MTVIESLFSVVKLRLKNMLHRIFKEKKKGMGLSQMVWGCFIGDKLGLLVFIDGTVNKNTYIQLLEQNLVLFIELLHKNGVSNIYFQQDNASPHHAKGTMD